MNEKKKVMLDIWKFVRDKYVLFEERDVDWDKVREEYENIIDMNDDINITDLISEMLIRLNDPHTKLIIKNKFILPIEVCCIEDSFFIINNREEYSNLNPGMKITSVNGIPIKELRDKVKYKYKYKSDNLINMEVVRLITTSNVEASVRIESGTIYDDLKYKPVESYLDTKDRSYTSNTIKFTSAVKFEDIGYIKVISFMSHNLFEEFKESLNCLSDCKNLIIDIRGNLGGYINQALKFVSLFIEKSIVIGYQENRLTGVIEELKVDPSDNSICNKFNQIVILSDNNTASSSEFIVLRAIKKYTNIKIIGTKSAGMPHSATVYNLSNGNVLLITTCKYLDENKSVILEEGINPNIEIRNTIESLLKGVDNQLEYAINYISQNI